MFLLRWVIKYWKLALKYLRGEGKTEKPKESGEKAAAEEQSKREGKKLIKKAALGRDVDISLVPLVTEKGVTQQENKYVVFRAAPMVSKAQVKQAVRARYQTEVEDVKSMIMVPKARRRGATVGKTARWKKFYVKVADVQKVVAGP